MAIEVFTLLEHDERRKTASLGVDRTGQRAFRERVLHAYGTHVPLPGKRLVRSWKQPYIQPYLSERSNHVQKRHRPAERSAQALRRGSVDDRRKPSGLCSPARALPSYRQLQGTALRLPTETRSAPAPEALAFPRTS